MRSPHKSGSGFIAMLSIILAVCCSPVRAAEPLSAQPAEQQSQPTSAQQAKKQPRLRKTHHHATASHAKARRTALHRRNSEDLALKSRAVLVVDQDSGEMLALKNPNVVMPIASLTKLMTALVVIDGKLPMDEVLEVSGDDIDKEKHTYSRLRVGTRLTRDHMLLLALMSSENRAAMALSRNYPGGREAFVAQMNMKAQTLGMTSTHFADPAGLSVKSVSTAHDLHLLLQAAYEQPLIRSDTTQTESTARVNGRTLTFINSNRLVRSGGDWDIELQKTGFTNEAGRCLVMQVNVLSRRLAMIFLDSNGKMTRYADAARVRRRLELDARNSARAIVSVAQ
jgi:D-alanyl-D-alanine endopeptidase (penicillin-binding protein 7)